MPLVWRELFTRASLDRSGASKQLAPQCWPHPGRIIFSKTNCAGVTCSDLERKMFVNECEQFDATYIPHDLVDGGARNRARLRNVRFQNRTELAGISRPRRAGDRGRLYDARRLERGCDGGQALWRAMAS